MRNVLVSTTVAMLAVSLFHSPGHTQEGPFSEGLAGALFHYQLTLGHMFHFMEECRPELMSDEARADREMAAAVMAASLNASGAPEYFSEETLGTMSTRLGPIDCDDQDLAEDAEWLAGKGWSADVTEALGHLGLTVVGEPLSFDRHDAVAARLEREGTMAARAIQCVAVTDPLWLPQVYGSWRGALAEMGAKLVSVGFPASRLRPILERAEAATVPEPVFGDVLAARKADCEADKDWESLFDADDEPMFAARLSEILAAE